LPPEAEWSGGTDEPESEVGSAWTNREAPSLRAVVPAVPEPSAVRDQPLGPEETVTLETELTKFVFTSHGGGVKQVQLKQYPETVGRRARRNPEGVDVATLNAGAPLPMLTLVGLESLGGAGYTLTRVGGGVRAERALPSGLRIIKEYLPSPDSDYLLTAAVRIENRTNQAVQLPVQEWVIGTATPISSHDRGMLIRMQWFNGRKQDQVAESWFANRTLGCIPGTPRSTYVAGQSNVVWASAQNQFFALITMSPTNEPAPQVVARRIDLPPPTAEEIRGDRQIVERPFGIQAAFQYPDLVLQPGQRVDRTFQIFAGPKEYRTLDRLGAALGNQVQRVMDFGGFFGFFAKALLLSMNGLHALGLGYGLAIIGITIVIKILFWPLTQASMRSMKRMQKLQPQMKELQERYKDDPKKMNERLMAFMKEHRINPAAGCLPIVVQIPVFFGFYKMLQSAIELRGAQFLWAFDLSQPDTIWVIPGLGFPLNPLPIIMGLTQFWQMRMTPPSPGMDPVQQKIFQYMPLIFLFILYNFSSGLTLYWTVQNLLTIAQMRLTKSTGEPGNATPVAVAPRAPGREPRRAK
jgi:YidC/Oxa1 family membrane protein insertase